MYMCVYVPYIYVYEYDIYIYIIFVNNSIRKMDLSIIYIVYYLYDTLNNNHATSVRLMDSRSLMTILCSDFIKFDVQLRYRCNDFLDFPLYWTCILHIIASACSSHDHVGFPRKERTHACPPTAKLSRFATVAVSTLTTNVFRSSQPPLDRFRWNENYTRPARPAIAISRRGYACRTLLPCRQTKRAAHRYPLPDFSQALEITTYLTGRGTRWNRWRQTQYS